MTAGLLNAVSLDIQAVDAQHPQALRLLAEAALEARGLYPELFAPDSPTPHNPPLAEREAYLLAYHHGHAVGCGALRAYTPFVGELRRMFVTRAARRQGVARSLVARLEAQAQRLGYRELVLETGRRQRPAIALYAGCGFRRIAAYGVYVGDSMSVCFGKRL